MRGFRWRSVRRTRAGAARRDVLWSVPRSDTGPPAGARLGLAAVAAALASSVAASTSPASSSLHSPSLISLLRGTAVGCGAASTVEGCWSFCCSTCTDATAFAGPLSCAAATANVLRPSTALLASPAALRSCRRAPRACMIPALSSLPALLGHVIRLHRLYGFPVVVKRRRFATEGVAGSTTEGVAGGCTTQPPAQPGAPTIPVLLRNCCQWRPVVSTPAARSEPLPCTPQRPSLPFVASPRALLSFPLVPPPLQEQDNSKEPTRHAIQAYADLAFAIYHSNCLAQPTRLHIPHERLGLNQRAPQRVVQSALRESDEQAHPKPLSDSPGVIELTRA